MTTTKMLAVLLVLLTCPCVFAADIVVMGRMIANEPMNHMVGVCSDGDLCMHSWWKSVIQVEKTVVGKHLAGRITAAVSQHVGMNPRYMKAIRFVILEPIEDPEQRTKLRADFYLKEASPAQSMFCSSYNPADIGLETEMTYVSEGPGEHTYCFEIH